MEKPISSVRENKVLPQLLVILFCILGFLDSALIAKGRETISLPGVLVILLLNVVLVAGVYIIRNSLFQALQKLKMLRPVNVIPLAAVILAFSMTAIYQFRLIPRYDAGLYYADYAAGVRNFDFSVLSFIRGFIVWSHPMHGVALFTADGEFFAPGQVTGTYIITLLLSNFTIILFYRLLKILIPKIHPVMAALGAGMFAFMPFMAGMFAYFNPDYYLILFFIWVIYSYTQGYSILTCFSGFLLLFTKETGGLLYVLFIFICVLSRFSADKGKALWPRIKASMPLGSILLWAAPVIALYPFLSHAKEWALIHNGIPLSETGGILGSLYYDPVYFASRLYQFFVMSFRWIPTAILLLVIIVSLIRSRRKKNISIFSENGSHICSGIAFSTMIYALFIAYLVSGLCPRYTGVAGIGLTIACVAGLVYLLSSQRLQILLASSILILSVTQTFITVDPSMTMYLHGIWLGKSTVYQVTIPEYDSIWRDCVGDLYCYNLSYSLYDDLANRLLTQIQPHGDDVFYTEDVYRYELHLFGMQNVIYWNTREKIRTYDGKDPDSIFIWDSSIYSGEIDANTAEEYLPDTFYIVDLARIEPRLKDDLTKYGFEVQGEYYAENSQGYLTAYKMYRAG